jgi:hypothetical protein
LTFAEYRRLTGGRARIADRHGMTVVTRSVPDFAVAGVPTLDPWAAS